MPLVTNDTRESLWKLAKLLNFPRKKFMTDVSNWLGIKRTTVSTWTRSDRGIPEEHIKAIEARGYPREKWLIEKSEDESTNMAVISVPGITKDLIKLIEDNPVLTKLMVDFERGSKKGCAATMEEWLESEGFSLGEELGAEEEGLEESVLKNAQNS